MSKELFYEWNGLNLEIFRFVNHLFVGNSLVSNFLVYFSELANIRVIPFLLIAMAFFIALYIYLKKLHLEANFYESNYIILAECLVAIFCSFFLIGIIAPLLKHYFDYLRPLCTLPADSINILPEPGSTIETTIKKRCHNDGSFPSAHAMISITIAASLWGITNFVGRFFLLLYIFIIGFSRLAIGLHYPADLIGGYLFGIFFFIIAKSSITFLKNIVK